MKKYLAIGVGVFAAVALLTAVASLAYGISFTGFTGLFKAFDKTLAPGEQYDYNITVRKFYNVSVRFQKQNINSSSYLGFDDNESVIVLKDSSGVEIAKAVGVKNGRAYVKLTNYELSSVAKISAYNISSYKDVIDQPVNDSVLSLSGTSAYITVKVNYPPASIAGYVVDDLTGEYVSGVAVEAFEDGANTNSTFPVNQTASDSNGRYAMTFDISDSKALDVYVDGYDMV
jgi:hypothetical protein